MSEQRDGAGWTFARQAGLAVAIALGARIAYGPGSPGYDASFHLLWGHEIDSLMAPDLTHPATPTPHPLFMAAGAVAELTGRAGGVEAFRWLAELSLGALCVACARLAGALFGPVAAVVAAVVVGSRVGIAGPLLRCDLDLAFLALAIGAAATAVSGTRGLRPSTVVLLVLAGLLRPEAWPAAAVCAGLLARRADGRRRALLAAAAVAAPLLWAASDLLFTGDPLFSLTDTQAVAQDLGRPRSAGDALANVPLYLRALLGDPVFWTSLVGLAVVLARDAARALVPGIVLVGGLAANLALGVAGLPVLPRYALAPMVALAVFAGAAVAWLPRVAGRARAAVIAAVLLGLVALDLGATLPDLRDRVRVGREVHAGFSDLEHVLTRPEVTAAARACTRVLIPGGALYPRVALWLDRPVAELAQYRSAGEPSGGDLVVAPGTREVARALGLDPATLVTGQHEIARSRDWRVLGRCR